MSIRLKTGHRIFVFNEYIDLRAGFDKLSMIIRERMKARLLDGDLFLFLGKNRKRLKALCFDGTGLLLIVKRLEFGRLMSLGEFESLEITTEELDHLLRGGLIRRTRFGEEVLTKIKNEANSQMNGAHLSRDKHRSTQTIQPLA